MENININFRDQFCTDIHRKVREIYSRWHNLLQSDLKDCDDNERLKYIDSKRIELRNKLFESKFKENFNLSDFNTNIDGCLEKYFKVLDISQAIGAEYFEFTNIGESKYDLETRKITVYPLKQSFTSKSYFKFSDLDRFKTLMEYISWGLSYLELNRLFDHYKGMQIYFQEEETLESQLQDEKAKNELKKTTSMRINRIVRYNKTKLPPFMPKEAKETSPELYKYYVTFARTEIKFVQYKLGNENVKLKDYTYNKLKTCCSEYNINFVEIISCVNEGYEKGRNSLINELKENYAKQGPDGVKAYLIKQVEYRNIRLFVSIHRKDILLGQLPDVFRKVGYNNALYYEAWVEIFKLHRQFNESFRILNIESYKKKSKSKASNFFPKRYIRRFDAPDSIQYVVDLFENCENLQILLTLDIIPYINTPGDIDEDCSLNISPKSSEDFKEFCMEFLKETANNHEKGLVQINRKFYLESIHLAEVCFELLKDPKFQECKMPIDEGYKHENWFVQIFNCLGITIDSFKNNYPFVSDSQDSGSIFDSKNSQVEGTTDEIPKETILDAAYFIGFMNGKNPIKGYGLILSEPDYLRLVSYTNYLISECKVPLDIIPMPKTNLTNQDIVYTYSLIHDHYINGKNTTKEYIVFIHRVFKQFNYKNIEEGYNYRKTTAYTKFREEPSGYKKLIIN